MMVEQQIAQHRTPPTALAAAAPQHAYRRKIKGLASSTKTSFLDLHPNTKAHLSARGAGAASEPPRRASSDRRLQWSSPAILGPAPKPLARASAWHPSLRKSELPSQPQAEYGSAKLTLFVQISGFRFAIIAERDAPVSWLISEALRHFVAASVSGTDDVGGADVLADHPEVTGLVLCRTGKELPLGEDLVSCVRQCGIAVQDGDVLEAVVADVDSDNDSDANAADPEAFADARSDAQDAAAAAVELTKAAAGLPHRGSAVSFGSVSFSGAPGPDARDDADTSYSLAGERPRGRSRARTRTRTRTLGTQGDTTDWRLQVLVWDDDTEALNEVVLRIVAERESEQQRGEGKATSLFPHPVIDMVDSRGNTPLQLALQLGRREAAKVLVEGGADVIRRDAAGWSVVQQAARLHDRALLESMVRASFVQVWQTWQNRVQWLLPMLKEIPDFDLTMEWDFACWVPLVSNMLPSDQLHVRKSGGKLRVDSSLASFSGMKWKHGRFSTLILLDEGGKVIMMDHDAGTAGLLEERLLAPKEKHVQDAVNHLRYDAMRHTEFVTKGTTVAPSAHWRSGRAKNERVGEFVAQQYKISGLQAVMKTRAPSEQRPQGATSRRANLRRQKTARLRSTLGKIAEGSRRRGSITVQEDESLPDGSGGGGGGGDGGMRDRAMSEWTGAVESGGSAHFTSYFRSEPTNSTPKTARAVVTSPVAKTRSERKTFDGVKLSMSTEFPLSKQMMASVVDVIGVTSQKYDNVKAFLATQLPDGFPVKFNLPIFPTITAAISFPRCVLCKPHASSFVVPPKYAIGAFEFPFERQ